MARIAGIDLPRDKRVEIALTYIYGIGANLQKSSSGPMSTVTPGSGLDGR